MQPGRSSELPDLDSAQVQVWGDPDEVRPHLLGCTSSLHLAPNP